MLASRYTWRASLTFRNQMELVNLATREIQSTIIPGPHWNKYQWRRLGINPSEGTCDLLSEAKAHAESGS
jgi:predicted DNA-binding protein (MmcQ/YjbR family)